MSDEAAPRRPLRVPTPEQLAAIRTRLGVGEENLPLGLTEAEQQAAANPGQPDTRWPMETKPGWKTSEFWLKLLAGLAIVALGFTINVALPSIVEQAGTVGWVGGLILVAAPLAKMGLGWVLHKLTETYADNRTEAKAATATALASVAAVGAVSKVA